VRTIVLAATNLALLLGALELVRRYARTKRADEDQRMPTAPAEAATQAAASTGD
jgi:hypothetical protein